MELTSMLTGPWRRLVAGLARRMDGYSGVGDSVRAAHEIDQGLRRVRNTIAAPGDMLIWTAQQQLVPVRLRKLRTFDVEHGEWHAASGGRLRERGDFDTRIEAQERVFRAHGVVERTSIGQPEVRSSAPRNGG